MDALLMISNGTTTETIRASASMGWMLAYERAFAKDSLMATRVALGVEESSEAASIVWGVLWAMAKNADRDLPAFDEWWYSYKDINIKEIVEVVFRLLAAHHFPREELPKSKGRTVSGKNSLMVHLAAGISRGLTLADTDRLTFGQWVDFIRAADRLSGAGTEEETRAATMADINSILGG